MIKYTRNNQTDIQKKEPIDFNYEASTDQKELELHSNFEDFETLDEEEVSFFECKEELISEIARSEESKKKVMLDNKIRKRVHVVNDYSNFYYLPESEKLSNLYIYTKKKQFRSKKFQQIKVTALTFDFKPNTIRNLTEENPILRLCNKKTNKNLILLNPMKGGYKAWYNGCIGFVDKRTAFASMVNTLNWNKIFFQKEERSLNAGVIDSNLNIYFPTIKNNFSKTRKRKVNFTEINLTFLDKDYAKNRKTTKTKIDKRARR